MSPDDAQTQAEARRVHPLFEARMARLAALAAAMPTAGAAPAAPGVLADLNDEVLLAIRAGIQRVERGLR